MVCSRIGRSGLYQTKRNTKQLGRKHLCKGVALYFCAEYTGEKTGSNKIHAKLQIQFSLSLYNKYHCRTTAMTTSQKHRRFCSEPMGDKLVYELPGIGPVLGRRLQNRGIIRAQNVLGRFLALNKDEWKFKNWLRDTCGANAKQQRDCYNCLREWTSNNL
ncbi:barrier-to-autointegration factor [Onychostoma macrolepis]|uniref:barrier-to-autointegration factor n=1 Tax=Onychostoma macrolepis TaxID=369639 RepID=UPI00272A4853|nr:barrier-to-autointegration factor [Onychostoma macrolepis]